MRTSERTCIDSGEEDLPVTESGWWRRGTNGAGLTHLAHLEPGSVYLSRICL